MKKKLLVMTIILLIVCAFLAFVNAGKITDDNANEYNTVMTYFDQDRKYVNDIQVDCNIAHEKKYTEEISLDEQKEHSISVKDNSLSKAVDVSIKDGKKKVIDEVTVKAGEKGNVFSDKKFSGGKYYIEFTFHADCNGSLEMVIDE